jgi:hypothetical protein
MISARASCRRDAEISEIIVVEKAVEAKIVSSKTSKLFERLLIYNGLFHSLDVAFALLLSTLSLVLHEAK